MKQRPLKRAVIAVIAFLLVCTSVLAVPESVEAATKKPTKITVTAAKKTLYVGEKYTLKVKSVKPAKASKAVTYKTSNKAVATVNAKGQIVAKKKGSATITVTSKGNKKVKATCKVTVKQQVKKITVTNAVSNTVAVRKGKTLTLKTSVSPSNASSKKLTFTSTNKKVATVNSKGKITARKAGTAKITIKSADKKAKTTITVKVPDAKKVVTKITLSPTSKTVYPGDKFTLKPTIKPGNATVKLVSYKSSNAKVAEVNSKGKVTAKGAGTATITVTTLDGGKKATCKVTVKPVPVSSVKLSQTSAALNIGQTVSLSVTIAPANAANKAVTWASSNPGVAAVANGVVTAKAAGTAVITATAADGSGKSASCTVTVKDPVIEITGVTMPESLTIYANNKDARLMADVVPANTTMSKAVTFTSSSAQLEVKADGTLVPHITDKTAERVEAIVTAASVNGRTAACKVTVIVNADAADIGNPYSFTLDKKAVSFDVTRNGKTISTTPDSIGTDIATLAGIQWDNSTLKEKWNDTSIQNLLGKLVLAEEFDLESRANIRVIDDITMEVTAKNKTAVITRTDNEDGTSSLKIAASGKTVYLDTIRVTERDTSYTVTMDVKAGEQTVSLEAEIKKDASAVILSQTYSDGDRDQIVSVTSDDTAYRFVIVKNMYKNLLEMVNVNDPVPTTTVKNCYVE